MKKFFVILAVLAGGCLSAFCEPPTGWDTMYFNHGEKEWCSASLEGDFQAQLEIYADAVVVSYEAPAKIKGDITLKVGDFTVKGKQDEYKTVTFVVKDNDSLRKFVSAMGDGSTPFVITVGEESKTAKLDKASAMTFKNAYRWIREIPNAMNYE